MGTRGDDVHGGEERRELEVEDVLEVRDAALAEHRYRSESTHMHYAYRTALTPELIVAQRGRRRELQLQQMALPHVDQGYDERKGRGGLPGKDSYRHSVSCAGAH